MNRSLPVGGWQRRQPLVPWVLIALCLLCLMMMASVSLLGSAQVEAWVHFWGFSPSRVNSILAQHPKVWLATPDLASLATALFVHVEWLHLLGNLAYLWVFGFAVERAVGHWRFALLFLLAGVFANLAVAWQMQATGVAVIGASGGVSGIIGVYLGLFPRRRMGLWIPLGLYLQFARVPALLVIGSWFALQLLYTLFGPMSEDVAWHAHVAGFVAGLVMAMIMRVVPGQASLAYRDD